MANLIVDEVIGIAEQLGYEGDRPDTVSAAFDALTETMGGTVEPPSKTVAQAIHALGPQIVSGDGGGSSTLVTKSVTANGIYAASDDSADGYSSVTVAVPQGHVPCNPVMVALLTDDGSGTLPDSTDLNDVNPKWPVSYALADYPALGEDNYSVGISGDVILLDENGLPFGTGDVTDVGTVATAKLYVPEVDEEATDGITWVSTGDYDGVTVVEMTYHDDSVDADLTFYPYKVTIPADAPEPIDEAPALILILVPQGNIVF